MGIIVLFILIVPIVPIIALPAATLQVLDAARELFSAMEKFEKRDFTDVPGSF